MIRLRGDFGVDEGVGRSEMVQEPRPLSMTGEA